MKQSGPKSDMVLKGVEATLQYTEALDRRTKGVSVIPPVSGMKKYELRLESSIVTLYKDD